MDIIAENISKSYGEQKVLKALSYTFPEGKSTCIMGPSGCGKTTLMRILLGLEKPDQGMIKGVPYGNLSAVFQEDRLCENVSALRNLKLVTDKKEEELKKAMEDLKLGDALNKPARELSGGMKRRVAILRALLKTSSCIMMDEPFKGLDEETKKLTAAYIREKTEKKTVLVITHDEKDMELLGSETRLLLG